jgi:hypothetical protein
MAEPTLRDRPILLVEDDYLLAQRRVPFVFATGYDQGVIPPRFAPVPRCEQPLSMATLARAIARVMSS